MAGLRALGYKMNQELRTFSCVLESNWMKGVIVSQGGWPREGTW